uniref:KIB1-4 beta-propeller domain-containing protein n=1 Tax=Oryza punctata TaxID=4537 RepID=A0A0E0JTH8_ORYPU
MNRPHRQRRRRRASNPHRRFFPRLALHRRRGRRPVAGSLLEAVTGRLYPLPPITSSGSKKVAKDLDRMGESMFQKAALVPGRRVGTFAVMLIHSGGFDLSFLRPDAKSWTAVRVPKWMKQKFFDVVFHQGAFYTVRRDAEVSAWTPDASSSSLHAREARLGAEAGVRVEPTVVCHVTIAALWFDDF